MKKIWNEIKSLDLETKVKIAHRATLVSGIFCGVVALLLILNFWQMKQVEPLESAALEVLMERLADEPNNEQLQREIRNFDLLARKAYFTSRWQVKTGTWLLLVSGIILAVSLKIHTDLRARIEKPEEVTENLLRARANAQYWLFMAGGLVLGLALLAGYVSNDYLGEYLINGRETLAQQSGDEDDAGNIEVIEVFPSSAEGDTSPAGPGQEGAVSADGEPAGPPSGDSGGEGAGGTSEAAAGNGSPGGTGTSDGTGTPETAGTPATTGDAAGSASSGGAFNPQDFKQNHATFRGYMGQGISYHDNIPVNWNGNTGENIRWKVAFSKPGYNSPVIWGDRVFISGGDEAARIVACYNRHTGQLMWEKEVTGITGSPATMPRVTDDTGLAAPTMAVDGKRVYAIFATGDVIAFDLNGNKVWGRNLGVPSNHYGHSSSLQVWKNFLVVQYDSNTGGRMLTLDTATGSAIWDVERPVHISWASPVLAEVDGRIQIVTTADPYVSAHDLETGEELWKVEAMMGEVGPSVAVSGGVVFASQEYARTLAIEPGEEASTVWEDDMYMSEVASPVAYNGLMYLATSYGVLVCYDAETGEILWEKEFDDGFYSSPMIADGKLYITDVGGYTHIMNTDREGTMIARSELGEAGFTVPAFADGRIYMRGLNHLYCIGE